MLLLTVSAAIYAADRLVWSAESFLAHATVTCPWSYQPAVEEAPSNRIVEDESPLAVHRLHHVFHGDGNVGVRAR